MFLLDTNVLSEPLAKKPNAHVMRWLTENEPHCTMSVISLEEMRYGVTRMPVGHRRDAIALALDRIVIDFGERLIPFDATMAQTCGELRAETRAQGNNVGLADIMIASCALVRGYTVVTRNIRDFSSLGVTITNPYE